MPQSIHNDVYDISLHKNNIFLSYHQLSKVVPGFYLADDTVRLWDTIVTVKEDPILIKTYCGDVGVENRVFVSCQNEKIAAKLFKRLIIFFAELDRAKWLVPHEILIPLEQKAMFSRLDVFMKSQELYKHHSIPYRRALLFYGPPGTGKTTLIRHIISRYKHMSVRRVTERWQIHGPAKTEQFKCLYIDEFEQLLGSVSDLTSRGALLSQLENVGERVLILASTNKPEIIDKAIFARPGRIEELVYVGNPTLSELQAVLKLRHCEDLCDYVEGLSFAQINELIYRVKIAKEDPAEVHKLLQQTLRKSNMCEVGKDDMGFVL